MNPIQSISPADFDAFVADQVVWLKSRLADKPDSLMPYLANKTLDMEGKDGLTFCALAMPFNEDWEKRQVLMGIGMQMCQEKIIPLAIALSCEAWLAHDPPKGVQPRHFAGRQEAVIVVAQSLGNALIKFVSIKVKRDSANRMEVIEESEPDREIKAVRLPILDHFFRGFVLGLVKEAK